MPKRSKEDFKKAREKSTQEMKRASMQKHALYRDQSMLRGVLGEDYDTIFSESDLGNTLGPVEIAWQCWRYKFPDEMLQNYSAFNRSHGTPIKDDVLNYLDQKIRRVKKFVSEYEREYGALSDSEKEKEKNWDINKEKLMRGGHKLLHQYREMRRDYAKKYDEILKEGYGGVRRDKKSLVSKVAAFIGVLLGGVGIATMSGKTTGFVISGLSTNTNYSLGVLFVVFGLLSAYWFFKN